MRQDRDRSHPRGGLGDRTHPPAVLRRPRRRFYLYIGFRSREKEVAILRVKVPGLGEQFAEEIAGFVRRVRAEDDFVKRPGISETLEWASALMTLGTTKLDRDIVEQTLGFVVKDAQDLQTMQSGRLDALLGSP